ncbi:UDP-glucose 4-epimerase GalE [Pectinatus haikarae]|uniref:UDP-glucose 4-epimerase n=1 Tax=Pectinatus haikarae TaxID=349096 RepID=A0ABT9Y6I3_9FIRM|nr:UDP-glucose 4-epimerase GalE [Pectinatus haikarae]MDQ0203130.1 UDP-glucose 4-epimerase [Pectinatus haikarae]
MAVLVCGGAGYIGSHMVDELLKKGEEPIVVDNLRTGHKKAVPAAVRFYQEDIRDSGAMDKIFTENDIEAVIHFAACSLVGESMEKPLLYLNNNVYGMQVLLETMVKHGVDKIVFSSSAATYGEPQSIPIRETDPTEPTNPYGESKLIMEKMMKWVCLKHGVRYVSLRYFNVAGASEDGHIGEDHKPESHLVPIILQVPLKKREAITIYGQDYPTEDGTCVRDYVHVADLADAHMKAINYLRAGGNSDIFNLGSGNGFSVKEMIDAARKATGEDIPVISGQRRSGDPARLVASSEKAEKVLKWKAKYTDMESIIKTAWKWHKNHPNGFCK